jgi:hypothetical protein
MTRSITADVVTAIPARFDPKKSHALSLLSFELARCLNPETNQTVGFLPSASRKKLLLHRQKGCFAGVSLGYTFRKIVSFFNGMNHAQGVCRKGGRDPMLNKLRPYILRLRVRFLVWSYNRHLRGRRSVA